MAYDNGYTGYAGYGQPANPSQLRNALAARMLQEGNDNSPIRSPWQGASRLGNALVGSMLLQKGMGNYNQGAADYNHAIGGAPQAGPQSAPLADPGAMGGAPPPPTIGSPMSGPSGGAMQPPGAPPGPPHVAMMAGGSQAGPMGQLSAPPPTGPMGPGQGPGPMGRQGAGQPPNFMEAPQPGPDQTAAILPALEAGIAKEESGGNYGAEGPVTKSGDRAYGKYQVMGSNVGPWTQEALGYAEDPQTFLHDKNAQEAVAGVKLGEYLDKTGNPADAASMWFTGHPLAQGAGMHDQLGTSGAQYAANATQGIQVADNSPQGGMQYAGGQGLPPPPPQGGVNTDALLKVVENPDADPMLRQSAMQMLQFYTMPQYQFLPARADGSVYEVDARHPTMPPVQVLGPQKVPQFTETGEDMLGQKHYGFVSPLDKTVTPYNPNGGGMTGGVAGPMGGPPMPPGVAPPIPSVGGGGQAPVPAPGPTQQPLPGASPAQPQPAQTGSATSQPFTAFSVQGEDKLPLVEQKYAQQYGPQAANMAATMARAMMRGDQSAATGAAQKAPIYLLAMQMAHEADPQFSSVVAASRAKTYNDYVNGTDNNSPAALIRNSQSALSHLGDLVQANEALAPFQSNNWGALNGMTNEALNVAMKGNAPGAKELATYRANLQPFMEELTKFYKGGVAGEGEQSAMEALGDPSKSPIERRAALSRLSLLLQGKTDELQREWHNSMGQGVADFPIIGPQGQAAITSAVTAGIPPAAINALRQNPAKAAEFDLKFGQGASARVLRQ